MDASNAFARYLSSNLLKREVFHDSEQDFKRQHAIPLVVTHITVAEEFLVGRVHQTPLRDTSRCHLLQLECHIVSIAASNACSRYLWLSLLLD